MLRIQEVIQHYKVNYLLTMEGVLNQSCIDDMPLNTTIISEASYLLYIFKE
jgi:hypothetical protein